MLWVLSHAILHTKQHEFSRDAEELIAESVAYVVCSQVGLDTGEYSFGYLASWKGDDLKMEEIGAVVLDVAGEVIKRVQEVQAVQ